MADARLRDDRFMPDPFKSFAPTGASLDRFLWHATQHYRLDRYDSFHQQSTRQMMVERAAQGLIDEGEQIGQ